MTYEESLAEPERMFAQLTPQQILEQLRRDLARGHDSADDTFDRIRAHRDRIERQEQHLQQKYGRHVVLAAERARNERATEAHINHMLSLSKLAGVTADLEHALQNPGESA